MKDRCKWWFALALVFLQPALRADDSPLRVVTWNLQWFPGKSPAGGKDAATAHVEEVQRALLKMSPDVIILQEVAAEDPVVKAISVLKDFRVSVVSRFKNAAGFIDGQQIAICSRFPSKFVHSAPWEKGWAGAPRGFAFAALDCGRGRTVGVYGLHLKSNLGDPQANTAKREDAIAQLLSHRRASMQAEASDVSRWIVCGDFNTDDVNVEVPSERTFRYLRDEGFFWTFDGVPLDRRISCPAKGSYKPASFDHIFTIGFGKPVASPLDDVIGSDHFPVAIDIQFSR